MKRLFNIQELSDKEICFFVAKAQGYNPKTTESYVFLETLDEQLSAWGKYINPYINPIMQKNFDPINNPVQGLKIIEENKISLLYLLVLMLQLNQILNAISAPKYQQPVRLMAKIIKQ